MRVQLELRSFAAIAVLIAGVAFFSSCRRGHDTTPKSGPDDLFVETAAEVGLDFIHDAGRTGKMYFPEIQGAGATFLFYSPQGKDVRKKIAEYFTKSDEDKPATEESRASGNGENATKNAS